MAMTMKDAPAAVAEAPATTKEAPKSTVTKKADAKAGKTAAPAKGKAAPAEKPKTEAKPKATSKDKSKQRDTSKATSAPRRPVDERLAALKAQKDKLQADHEKRMAKLDAKIADVETRHAALLKTRELSNMDPAELERIAKEAKEKAKLARRALKLAGKK